ncbi:MAG: FixH family protein, partial [Candidatus Rokuibacteriota bacterium]
LEAEADAPLSRRLRVEVRDPAGKDPVSDATVTVRALHAGVGSGLRVEPVPLGPAREPGTYQGTIRFPGAGRWELTIEVVGRYVGDAHLVLDVAGGPAGEAWTARRKPDLPFDAPTVRHLAMEWGHLAGFALWLLATGVGLLEPTRRRGLVVAGTWLAFAVEGATGLYKMEFSTPFATPLRLFRLDQIPRVFFAEDYVGTLVVKHGLMAVAVAITLALTVHAWWTKPGAGVRVWRALLGLNLLLALAIAAAAAVLGLYHAIVLHFS